LIITAVEIVGGRRGFASGFTRGFVAVSTDGFWWIGGLGFGI
jgi:hypothetical protein